MIDNSKQQQRIRKAKDTLIIIGNGIMVFAVWTIMKTLGIMLATKQQIIEYIKNAYGEEMGQVSDALVFGSFVFMMMFLILIGVLVRIYIGRSAIRQAKGKKKSSFYLVLTAVLILLGVMSIISSVQKWMSGYETQLAVEDISLASILIEVTSVVMFVELFVNAIKLRCYQREEKNAA